VAASTSRALNDGLRAGALALALASAGLGCDSGSGEDPLPGSGVDGGSFPMELGRGELEFEPIAEGDTLPYARGGQGGQHVFVAFRMRDLDPMRVLITVTTAIEGEADLVLERRGRVDFEPDEDGATDDAGAQAGTSYSYAGWPAQILDADEHVGARTLIDVLLEDREGRNARAAQTVVIGPPE
jgi:hypothetical protein